MAQVSGRTGFNGSALTRLLSRLSQADVREPRQVTAERLSQWFGWTDAISLSAALNGNSAASAASPSGARAGASAEESECNRVRAALASAIEQDSTFLPSPKGDAAMDPTVPVAFSPFRQRYLARQQAMEAGVGPLRGKLRARLAGRSGAMARLAAVDVVMEQVLGAQERSLLAGVPALLETHFKRLRQAAPDAWLDRFRRDAREVLLAELDLRFQPVDGLLEALRAAHRDIPQ